MLSIGQSFACFSSCTITPLSLSTKFFLRFSDEDPIKSELLSFSFLFHLTLHLLHLNFFLYLSSSKCLLLISLPSLSPTQSNFFVDIRWPVVYIQNHPPSPPRTRVHRRRWVTAFMTMSTPPRVLVRVFLPEAFSLDMVISKGSAMGTQFKTKRSRNMFFSNDMVLDNGINFWYEIIYHIWFLKRAIIKELKLLPVSLLKE